MKSRWSTTFSRIENLWPRDGSCPLPLRSKLIFNKCFRIVKAKKISRGCSAHVMGSPFAPNEVPAPVCAAALSGSPTESVRLWHSITFERLMQDSRFGMKKQGAVRTLRPASFKHKNNALRLFCQQPKANFMELYNHIRLYL